MPQARDRRRLAAILLGDVAGYSRLMGADEAATLGALKAHRAEVIDPALAAYEGRLVSTPGDGILVEFASAVDAVACAVAIQRAIAPGNASVPEDRRIVWRMGINVGDIIIDGNDIYGDGVNIAARLEALCEPGGVCIARSVLEQIENKLHFPFTDRGELSLKNIARPVRIFDLSAKDIAGLPATALPKGREKVPSTAKTGPGKPVLASIAAIIALGSIVAAASYSWFFRSPAPKAVPAPAPKEGDPLAAITSYVNEYDGGDCVFLLPLRVASNSAGIEALALSREAMNAFRDKFTAAIGFAPEITTQWVSQAQCPAVDFLRKVHGAGEQAPALEIKRISLQPGQSQAGEIRGADNRAVALLHVQEDGLVRDMSGKLVTEGDAKTFEFPLTHRVGAPAPQLLMAIASAKPMLSGKGAEPVPADRLFPALAATVGERSNKIAAAARLFLLRP